MAPPSKPDPAAPPTEGPAGAPAAGAPRRRRLKPEAARRAILDAAAARLRETGPDGLRLQPIAADLGISHASILHHFGSREGLLESLSQDAFSALDRDLRATLEAPPTEDRRDRAGALLGRIARTLGDEGHAKLLAWQFLSGRLAPRPEEAAETNAASEAGSGPPPSGVSPMLGRIAEVVHRVRRDHAERHQLPRPPMHETQSFVFMISCALFGEAIAGDAFAKSIGLDAATADRGAYRAWLADLSTQTLFGESPRPDQDDSAEAPP